jgi:hypothetical protein
MGFGGQCCAPTSLPKEKPGNPCAEGWVDPRASLEGADNLAPHQSSHPVLSSP